MTEAGKCHICKEGEGRIRIAVLDGRKPLRVCDNCMLYRATEIQEWVYGEKKEDGTK